MFLVYWSKTNSLLKDYLKDYFLLWKIIFEREKTNSLSKEWKLLPNNHSHEGIKVPTMAPERSRYWSRLPKTLRQTWNDRDLSYTHNEIYKKKKNSSSSDVLKGDIVSIIYSVSCGKVSGLLLKVYFSEVPTEIKHSMSTLINS